MEDTIEVIGDTAVPRLADTTGFCSALFFIDRNLGHSILETSWRDPQALAGSRSTAAPVRVDTVLATNGVIRALRNTR